MNPKVLNSLLSILGQREYSELALRQKLATKGFNPAEISQALSYAKEYNYQNDYRFAENYIRARSRKGYGKQRIVQELKQQGIANYIIQELMATLPIDWPQIINDLINKKMPISQESLDLKNKQKLWRYLINHGFQPDEFISLLK